MSKKVIRRAYGHGKFGRCGKDDRGAPPEFQHLDLEGFNRALDRFLEKRDPDYARRKAFWKKENDPPRLSTDLV